MYLSSFCKKALLFCMSIAMLVGSVATVAAASEGSMRVEMLIPGQIDDGGFMESGYKGLMAIRDQLGAEIGYIDEVEPDRELLVAALRKLAERQPDLIIAHGGQNSKAVVEVAPQYPNIKFVVTQGNVTGPNLSSYVVLQEQSAWLAGAAAGILTNTGIVGHISGIRVSPGLKGRAAFADGLNYTNPDARFLTTFAGDQDDVELAMRVTRAQIKKGADIIFTMLNAARKGAINAMREAKGVKQIGNVREWYPDYPDVFVGSAIANVSMAALRAAKDVKNGTWKPGRTVEIGLAYPNAVRLSLAPYVSDRVRSKIKQLAQKIVDGDIEVSTHYDGPEFQEPASGG